MTQVIAEKLDDGTIWVTSNDDSVGSESQFSGIPEEEHQFLIALADFLMLTPTDLINIGYEMQALEEE